MARLLNGLLFGHLYHLFPGFSVSDMLHADPKVPLVVSVLGVLEVGRSTKNGSDSPFVGGHELLSVPNLLQGKFYLVEEFPGGRIPHMDVSAVAYGRPEHESLCTSPSLLQSVGYFPGQRTKGRSQLSLQVLFSKGLSFSFEGTQCTGQLFLGWGLSEEVFQH